jgi:DNA-binding Xre family transcriptional regulator
MHTKGGGTALNYHTAYIVRGGEASSSLDTVVTPSEVMDNEPMLDLPWRVRFR